MDFQGNLPLCRLLMVDDGPDSIAGKDKHAEESFQHVQRARGPEQAVLFRQNRARGEITGWKTREIRV